MEHAVCESQKPLIHRAFGASDIVEGAAWIERIEVSRDLWETSVTCGKAT